MASIEQRNGSYRIVFRHGGRKHSIRLGKVTPAEAKAKASHVDYLLLRLDQGLLALPDGVDVVDFVASDGKPRPAPPALKPAAPPGATLATIRDLFLEGRAGSLEGNTLTTARIHFAHLAARIGEAAEAASIDFDRLQGYIRARADEGLAAATIRKELDTLRAAWNWARRSGRIRDPWPGLGLSFPRASDRPPFRTREEIAASGAQAGSWECLYLTRDEANAILERVRAAGRWPWILPMVAAAIHTGMRRSELIRAEAGDVDLAAGVIAVRERKRARGRSTFRQIPISARLAAELRAWLPARPACPWLFATAAGGPITVDASNHHLWKTLEGSEWSVIPGWHTFRHSFASICAASGIDQRLIDGWMGHQTEEQRRRYQHLFPRQQRDAIGAAFD